MCVSAFHTAYLSMSFMWISRDTYSQSLISAGSPIFLVLGNPCAFCSESRKFFCDVPTCPRKIFAERLAPFVAPYARVTGRLFQIDETHWSGYWWEAGCTSD